MSGVCKGTPVARTIIGGAAAILLLAATASAQTSTSTGQVTFTKDVAPILQRSCVTCHRAGEMAPMSLMTYEDARPWARAIKTRTAAREMPPFHIDKIDRHHVVQERSVAERRGDCHDRQVGRRRRAARQPGRHAAAAAVRRRQHLADSSLTSSSSSRRTRWRRPDRICTAISTPTSRSPRTATSRRSRPARRRPGSRKVVHHALSYAVDEPDKDVSGDDSLGVEGGDFLVEYASGKNAEVYPGDSGVLLQAGKKAMVQLSPALDRRRDRRRTSRWR